MGIVSDMSGTLLTEMGDMTETITYTPSGGSALSISAHVFRGVDKDRNLPNEALGKRRDFVIYINRSDVSDVTQNADLVSIKTELGNSTTDEYMVSDIIHQDAGSYTLRIR